MDSGNDCPKQRSGPFSYRIQVDLSTQWRRHADKIVTPQILIMFPDAEIPEPNVSSSVSVENLAEKLSTSRQTLPKKSTLMVKPTIAIKNWTVSYRVQVDPSQNGGGMQIRL